jgi:energy-coupling factor transporter ATP-binding protein EcfA2
VTARLSTERPFPGLRAFGIEDRDFFFGREDHIASLYRLLDRNQFIAVVGSSGSGKSSLVRAGLLPLIQKETEDEGGRNWRFATLNPGNAPLAALASAVAGLAADEVSESVDDRNIRYERAAFALRRSSFGLTKAIDENPALAGKNVLLVVDQFEEIFRYGSIGAGKRSETSRWRDEAATFVQLLLEATRSHSSPVNVLITMRSDFIGDCSKYYGLPESVSASQFLVPSLTRDQREDVMRQPIGAAGASIDSALVQRLLNDAGSETDELPVLQQCLSRLWERAAASQPRQLTLADYERIGTIKSALSRHADEVMQSPELVGLGGAVEQVFRALTWWDDEGRATRRAIPYARLVAETGASENDVRRIVDRFRKDDCSFIVTSPPAVATVQDDTLIDVVHEALLRRWDKISGESGWRAAEERDSQVYRGLLALLDRKSAEDKATLPLNLVQERWEWWSGRDQSGKQIHPKRTQAWTERYGGNFAAVEQLFANSLADFKRDTEDKERRERLEHQAEEAHRNARLAQRTRIFATIVSIVALIAIAASVFGFTQQARANAAAEQARTVQIRLVTLRANQRADLASRMMNQTMKYNHRLTTLVKKNADLANTNGNLARKNGALAQKESILAAKEGALVSLTDRLRARAVKSDIQHTAQADSASMARLDSSLYRARATDYRTAALIGIAAYVRSPTAEAQDMLLEGLETDPYATALAHVALPPWKLGAVAGHGRFIAVLTSPIQTAGNPRTGELLVLDAVSLAVLSRLPNVNGTFMCGFDASPHVAIGRGNRIDLYDLSASRAPRRIAGRQVQGLRAAACASNREGILTADSDGTLQMLDLRGLGTTVIGRAPGARAVILSSNSDLAAAISNDGAIDIFMVAGARRIETQHIKDFASACTSGSCAAAVAFSPDEKHYAWYDSGIVYVAPVAGGSAPEKYPCDETICAHPALFYSLNDFPPYIVSAGKSTSEYRGHAVLYIAKDHKYEEASSFSFESFNPMPFWDQNLAMFVTNDVPRYIPNPYGSALATHSMLGYSAPLLGLAFSSQWYDSFALRGNDFILPQERGAFSINLSRFRDIKNLPNALSYHVRLRDSGDGRSAVALNYVTGEVQVLGLDSPPRILTSFKTSPVPVTTDANHFYVDDRQIAYDPQRRIITIAAKNGVTRFSIHGKVLSHRSWQQLASIGRVHFPDWGPKASSNYARVLSSRGNYLLIRERVGVPDWLLRIDGTRVGSALAIRSITGDERFAFARASATDPTVSMYALPAWKSVGLLAIPATARYVALSPNGSRIALIDPLAERPLSIYDVASKNLLAIQLPNPPSINTDDTAGTKGFRGLTFSADNRYLIATYFRKDISSPEIAVYTLDPNDWIRRICLMAGQPLGQADFNKVVNLATLQRRIPYSNGCAAYASHMYRW